MKSMLLCAYWRGRPLSFEDYCSLLKSFAFGLREFSERFKKLYSYGATESEAVKISSSMDNFYQCIEKNLPKGWAFTSEGQVAKSPTLSSMSSNGFMSTLATTMAFGSPGATIEISCGSTDPAEVSNLIVRLSGDELTNSIVVRKLLMYVIKHWTPAFGYVTAGSQPVDSDIDEIPLGWLTYIESGHVESIPHEVGVESLGSGTLFEIPGGSEPDSHPEFQVLLVQLREALRTAGKLVDTTCS